MICVRALMDRAEALRALRDPAWRVRDVAARALDHAETNVAVHDALTQALNDGDARVIATAEGLLNRLRQQTQSRQPSRKRARPVRSG